MLSARSCPRLTVRRPMIAVAIPAGMTDQVTITATGTVPYMDQIEGTSVNWELPGQR